CSKGRNRWCGSSARKQSEGDKRNKVKSKLIELRQLRISSVGDISIPPTEAYHAHTPGCQAPVLRWFYAAKFPQERCVWGCPVARGLAPASGSGKRRRGTPPQVRHHDPTGGRPVAHRHVRP